MKVVMWNSEGSNVSQIISILIITLASFTSGALFMWPTAAIPILMENKENPITIEEASYFSIFPGIALVASAPIFAYLVDKIGRKNTMTIAAVPQILSWAFTAYEGHLYVYYIARILYGISDAAYYTAALVFYAEISTPKVRGTWGNGLPLMAYSGNFLAPLMVFYLNIRISAIVNAFIPLVMLVAMQFIPESPYFLIMKKKDSVAYKALQWYRCKKDVQVEFKQLALDVHRQLSESGCVKDLFVISSNRRAIAIGGFLRTAQQFGGISAIATYVHVIFSKNISNISPTGSSLIYLGQLVICNLIAALILGKIGKRIAMVVSCAGCGLLLSVQAVYFYFLETNLDVSDFNLVPLIGLSAYVLLYAVGIGIIPAVMIGELFSSSVKGKCLCVMNIFYGLLIPISTKIFQLLMSNFGNYAAFAFFTVTCLISAVVSFFVIPETGGKTLEEIQQGLKNP